VVLCFVDPGVGMSSPSSKSAPGSKSFLWTFPECPLRIHVNLQFVESLRKILNSAADHEVGGLLIGKDLSRNGDIEVSDYFQLPPAPESSPNFVICSDLLAQSIKSASAVQGRVIGFYRTHLEQRIQLRPKDLECARSNFSDPMNVFLVIRPHDGRASAAFFFWQDGSVVGGLTFPFSCAELTSPSWTTLVGGSPRPSRLNILLARARDRALETSNGVRIGLLILVVILVALGAAWRIYQPSAATSRPVTTAQSHSQTLGLRVEKALMGVVIAWNPETPEIAAAKDANLLIWDGSSPPAFIRLTTAQLHAGRAFFAAVSDRVEVRIDVIGAAGRARTESMVAEGRTPDIVSADPPAKETSALVPTKETSPAPAGNTRADSSPKPSAEKARGSARPFIPTAPVGKASGGSAEFPKPPELESPDAAALALTQTFHSFNDPQAAVSPKQQSVSDAPLQKTALVAPAKPTASSFQAAVPTREVRPAIPAQLRELVQSDNVVQIQVHISASGSVTDAKLGAVQGPAASVLSKLALNAARSWHFRPATQNGQAVPSDKILEFLFRPSSP
jgi:TonB family protein